jgi:hypothetical protein
MKILLVLGALVLAAALIVSATMGAGTLVPGGSGDDKQMPRGTVAGQKGKPRILAVSLSPLVIKGTGFVPGEHVIVKIIDGPKAKRRTTADAQGAFTVRVPTRFDRCNGMTVSAVGDKGSKTGFALAEFLCAAPSAAS